MFYSDINHNYSKNIPKIADNYVFKIKITLSGSILKINYYENINFHS